MSMLKLARLDDPLLHRRTKPVATGDIGQKWFEKILDQLVQAMRVYDGVGIAANQAGLDLSIFACEVSGNKRYPDAPDIPLQIYVNPRIVEKSDIENVLQEGCLSVPVLRGDVPRAETVVLEAFDRTGKPVRVSAAGFLARIFQHECDHLNGHIFLERVTDFGSVVRIKKSGD